jgi:uncharacterized protein (DUF305 family)
MRGRTPRLVRIAAGALTAAVLLLPSAGAAAASTQAERGGSDRTVRHDVTFIAMLLPHHQTAVDMANIARHKATNPQVRQLAAHIADEQSRQITQMRRWLRERDAEPMPPPGPVQEMNRQDIRMLRHADGNQVDRMFLMMMRPHHAQGVSEAEDELEHGRNNFALDLARTSKRDQVREIAQMNDLLASLS